MTDRLDEIEGKVRYMGGPFDRIEIQWLIDSLRAARERIKELEGENQMLDEATALLRGEVREMREAGS